MATFNCGTTKKKFTGAGSAVGPAIITEENNVFARAFQAANNDCLEKCNDWIDSKSCKDTCKRKTSRIEHVSASLTIAPAGPGKIRVTVKRTLRAIVQCKS